MQSRESTKKNKKRYYVLRRCETVLSLFRNFELKVLPPNIFTKVFLEYRARPPQPNEKKMYIVV